MTETMISNVLTVSLSLERDSTVPKTLKGDCYQPYFRGILEVLTADIWNAQKRFWYSSG